MLPGVSAVLIPCARADGVDGADGVASADSLDGADGVNSADAFTIDERAVFNDMDRSYLQGYRPGVAWDYLTLVIPVRSETAAGNIQAELIPRDADLSPFRPQSMLARTQRVENGLWALRFQLSLFTDRTNGDYPCTVRVTGADAAGGELLTELPFIIPIRDGQTNQEPLRLTVSEKASVLRVGEDGTLSVTIKNPSRSVGFEHLSLTVRDPGGDILPKTQDSVALDDLMPGESLDLVFPVTVLPGAKVAPHSLQFDFTGASLGREARLSLCYTVSVRQEIRLEQGGLRMAESVVAGDSVTAALPLMNMGKADIVNAMVTVSLPGITERQSVLVGTIQPGETRQAQLTLTAPKDALGERRGTLAVSGEDNDGNSVSFELPVSLTVEEAIRADSLEAQQTAGQKTPAAVPVLSAVCAALAIALIAQGVLLRGKLRRLEEERL